MIQAYSNLMESGLTRSTAKSHTLKKSEAKRIYENILKLSRNSGFYKINMSKENQEYTFGVKEMAILLKSEVSQMVDPEHPAYHQKYVSVSDERLLEAKLVNKDINRVPDQITIDILALAAPQVNTGNDLFQHSRYLEPGNYGFRANVLGSTYDLCFRQKERMSNGAAVNRMADYLQKAIPELKIAVEEPKKDYCHLRIEAGNMGEYTERMFSFEDIEAEQEGVVGIFGLDRMSKAAQKARFAINGLEKETYSNTFQIESTLQITLHGVGDQPVTLKIRNSPSQLLDRLDSILENYNDLVRLSVSRRETMGNSYSARKLTNELKRIEALHRQELDTNGITISEDGMLQRDIRLSDEAAQNGSIQNFFTNKNGFIAALLEKAEEIAINPMDYLDKTIVTYPDHKKPISNPYMTSIYSGLFFSSYC